MQTLQSKTLFHNFQSSTSSQFSNQVNFNPFSPNHLLFSLTHTLYSFIFLYLALYLILSSLTLYLLLFIHNLTHLLFTHSFTTTSSYILLSLLYTLFSYLSYTLFSLIFISLNTYKSPLLSFLPLQTL